MRTLRRVMGFIFISYVILVFSLYLSSCNREVTDEPGKTKEEVETEKGQRATAETQGSIDKGAISVLIEPQRPRRGDVLIARIKETKGKPIYKWYVNVKLITEGEAPSFNTDGLKRGDSVMVRVVTSEGEFDSEPVNVVNSQPVIDSAYLLPISPKKDDILRADVKAKDPDGDEVSMLYQWSINGASIEETSNTLKADIKRGDSVSVRITPFDGELNGMSVERSVIIGNAPPVVENEVKDMRVKDKVLTGKIVATDPDGDSIDFSLIDAPEGMTIDKNGIIKWNLPETPVSTYSVSVAASDGYGGESILNFELSLKAHQR